jgi:hypothetical protein
LLTRLADTIDRYKELTPAQKARLQALYRRLLGL